MKTHETVECVNQYYWQHSNRMNATRLSLTGTTLGLLEMRSALVMCLVWSSVHRTSNVNSTEQSLQNSSHVQSYTTQHITSLMTYLLFIIIIMTYLLFIIIIMTYILFIIIMTYLLFTHNLEITYTHE